MHDSACVHACRQVAAAQPYPVTSDATTYGSKAGLACIQAHMTARAVQRGHQAVQPSEEVQSTPGRPPLRQQGHVQAYSAVGPPQETAEVANC